MPRASAPTAHSAACRAAFALRTATGTALVTAVLASAAVAGTPRSARAANDVRQEMLVDGAWLAAHLDQPGLVVLHVGKSRDAYDHGHVPGARFVAFADVATSRGAVPNEMPPLDELTALVRRLGITGEPGERIVIYDQEEGLSAARTYVALDYLGLAERAALLDGHWAGWQAEQRPVTAEAPQVAVSSVVPHLRRDRIVDRSAVADITRAPRSAPATRVALVDARPPLQFAGTEASEGVPRPGHIPGALGAFWKDDLQGGAVPRLRSTTELYARYAALGVGPGDVVVAYCRTGAQASHTYFVLSYLGYDVRLYDGSFAEWSAGPGDVAR